MNARWVLVVLLTAALPGIAFDGQEKRVIRVTAERFSFTPSRIENRFARDVRRQLLHARLREGEEITHGYNLREPLSGRNPAL